MMDKKLEEYFSIEQHETPPFLNTSMIELKTQEQSDKQVIRLLFISAFLLMAITLLFVIVFSVPVTKIIVNFGWLLVILPLILSLVVLVSIYTTMKGSFK